MMEIGEPSVLAKLPQSRIENGRILYTQVHSLDGALKRRRQELCAAIDGDSVNIYEVRQGRILSSCPIPPDAVLLCPPCSVHWRNQTGAKIRSTYYVTSKRDEIQLSLHQQELNGKIQRPLSKSIVLNNVFLPVIRLEVLPASNTHAILLLRGNGQYEVFKMDLSARVQCGTLQGSSDDLQLIAAQAFSPAQASKSVLKARPDIVAMSDSNSSFILGVSSTSDARVGGGSQTLEIDIWLLQSLTTDAVNEPQKTPIFQRSVTTSSPLLSKENDPIVFVLKDTRLIVRTQAQTYVFDLTLTTLRKIQETPQTVPEQYSRIFISDNLALFSTPSTIQLENSQFRTILSKLDLNNTTLKRKRSNVPGGSVNLIAFYPALKRIVATRRDRLIAIDIQTDAGVEFSNTIAQADLLINNLGRGNMSQDPLKSSDHARKSFMSPSILDGDRLDQWHCIVHDLELLIQDNSFAKFEEVALENLTPRTIEYSTELQMPEDYKVDYMISKIFRYETTKEKYFKGASRNIKLAIPVLKLLEVLAVSGYLSIERINKILRTTVKSNFEPIKHGALSQVLIENDESLSLLCNYLQGGPPIVYQESCKIVQLLLSRALADPDASTGLTISAVQSGHPIGNDNPDAVPTSTGSKGTIAANVSACLSAAIERLAETSSQAVSSFIRDSFSPGEIIALVQFARQQLFLSGYTQSLQAQSHPNISVSKKTPSNHHETLFDGPSEPDLYAIIFILSTCIDAIGLVGFLNFGDDEEFIHTLISDLSSEIAKAIEAIQEMKVVEGVLRETLRYMDSTEPGQALNAVAQNGLNDEQSESGTFQKLYSEPTTAGNLDESNRGMPLGLRNEDKASNRKIMRATGKTLAKDELELATDRDNLRGMYTLQRLNL